MGELSPTAAGALAATPLPNLLAYVLDHKLTGTLVVEDPESNKSALGFRRGYPVKARTSENVILLGRVLVDSGLLEAGAAESVARQAEVNGALFGDYVVAQAMVSRKRVEDALREQSRRRIRWMFALPGESRFGFYEGNLLEGWGSAEGVPVAVLPLVWQGIRAHAPDERVRAVLGRLTESLLKLHIDADLERFEFDHRERALGDVLQAKPQRLASLLATGLVDEAIAQRMIYMLAITRHLDLGAGGRPIGVDESRAPMDAKASSAPHRLSISGLPTARLPTARLPTSGRPPPGTLGTSGEESRDGAELDKAELRRRAARVLHQNCYEVLGVDHSASAATVQAAYLRLAKIWHPDRQLDRSGDPLFAQIFARLSEAHAVLTDPQRRQKYDESLARGGGMSDQEKVARVLRAASAHQRALVLLKRNKLQDAELEANSAVEDDPDQPDYLALLAWIRANQPERMRAGRYGDLVLLLNRAVKLDPHNERARYWRGEVLKRAGQIEEAMRDFRWVNHSNPHHVDAARELRLHEMRGGSSVSGGGKAQSGSYPRAHSTNPPTQVHPPGEVHSPGLLRRLFKG